MLPPKMDTFVTIVAGKITFVTSSDLSIDLHIYALLKKGDCVVKLGYIVSRIGGFRGNSISRVLVTRFYLIRGSKQRRRPHRTHNTSQITSPVALLEHPKSD